MGITSVLCCGTAGFERFGFGVEGVLPLHISGFVLKGLLCESLETSGSGLSRLIGLLHSDAKQGTLGMSAGGGRPLKRNPCVNNEALP